VVVHRVVIPADLGIEPDIVSSAAVAARRPRAPPNPGAAWRSITCESSAAQAGKKSLRRRGPEYRGAGGPAPAAGQATGQPWWKHGALLGGACQHHELPVCSSFMRAGATDSPALEHVAREEGENLSGRWPQGR